jgi:hypothetical protein
LLGLESRLLTVLAAEETATTPDAAANAEIEFRQRKLEDQRRDEARSLELSELLSGQ